MKTQEKRSAGIVADIAIAASAVSPPFPRYHPAAQPRPQPSSRRNATTLTAIPSVLAVP